MNGGAVDCEMNAKGDERVGEITANTTCLVLGKAPTAEAAANVWTKMVGDAERLGVKKVTLDELLRQVGYKDVNPVVQYGLGGTVPKAKPPEGAQRTSTGSTTSAFTPRNPPRSGN